jgi:hypothetical protein
MPEELDLSFCPQCNQLTVLPCSECTQQMDEASLLQYLRSFEEHRQIAYLDKGNVRVIEKRDIRIPPHQDPWDGVGTVVYFSEEPDWIKFPPRLHELLNSQNAVRRES